MCAAHAAHMPQAQPEEGTLAGSAGWRKPKTPQSTSEHPHRRRGVLRLAPLKVEARQLGQVEVAGETEPGAARPRRPALPARSNPDTERRQQSGPRSQTSTMGSRPGFASPLGDPAMGSEVWSVEGLYPEVQVPPTIPARVLTYLALGQASSFCASPPEMVGKDRRRFGEGARASVVHAAGATPSAPPQPSSWPHRSARGAVGTSASTGSGGVELSH
jgi:hypothetical protein